MTFTSFYFLVFLACLLGIYYIVPKRCQIPLLVIASLVFSYCADGIRLIIFLTVATISTWYAAIRMEDSKSENGKKIWFWGVLCLNLGILVSLKYLNFFVYTGRALGQIFHKEIQLNEISLIAPLGLSFYTLQVLGYLIDVSGGAYKAERNVIKYAAFSCFFPQLVTGPINRYDAMSETLYAEKRFDYMQVTFGLQRIAWGFFKKLVISERLAVLVNTIYGDWHTYSGLFIVFGTICFAFQLYTDFSGAIDIALGVSEALGVRMAENFDTPFFSRSLSEFWRRWHITLGGWMKDYIFYPMLKSDPFIRISDMAQKKWGKKKGKKVAVWIGLLVLWFILGMWHGGSWKYIVGSGLLHCFYIVGGQMMEPVFMKIARLLKVNMECYSFHLFQKLRTFSLVCVGFVFFRADSFRSALAMLKASLRPNIQIFLDGSLFELGLDVPDFIIGLLALGVILIISLLQQKLHAEGTGIREKLAEQNLVFRWIVFYTLIFSVIVFGFYGPEYDASSFIYEKF